MNAYLIHNGSSIMDIFYCPHDWDEVAFAESLRPVYSLWLKKNIILIYLKHILSEMIFAMKFCDQKCRLQISYGQQKKGLKI